MSPDMNVERVREKLLQRSIIGLKKYNCTTERTDLTELEWMIHWQDELLDAAVYAEVMIAKMRSDL